MGVVAACGRWHQSLPLPQQAPQQGPEPAMNTCAPSHAVVAVPDRGPTRCAQESSARSQHALRILVLGRLACVPDRLVCREIQPSPGSRTEAACCRRHDVGGMMCECKARAASSFGNASKATACANKLHRQEQLSSCPNHFSKGCIGTMGRQYEACSKLLPCLGLT